MSNNSRSTSEVSIEETIFFLLFNFILILIGIILWYYLWIKKQLVESLQLINDIPAYFSSRNLYLILSEMYKHITQFNPLFLTKTIGHEAYGYLLFQRRIISLLFSYFIFSVAISLITIIVYKIKGIESDYRIFLTFLINAQYFENMNTVLNIITIALFTFLHFRTFSIIKNEAKHLYFSRFDKMSQVYNENWLTCRTLHISGIAAEERNTSVLEKKLNAFLSKTDSGKVIDINFIPNYHKIIQYEKKNNEIKNLRLIISKKKPFLKCCFSSVYWSEESVENELKRIEAKLDELTEKTVLSSGHAFICFDSLTAADQILKNYKETTWTRFKVKMISIFEKCKKTRTNDNSIINLSNNKENTFRKFKDEFEINEIQLITTAEASNVNILVDQLIEPVDIIWDNVGGDRGLYFWRRIFLNLILIALLVFFTTPTSLFTTMQKFDYFKVLEFDWIVKIPYGYLIVTYCVPLVILTINLGLIILIDYIAKFEKHYTHSNYHYAVFGKSFIYMLLNFLIIPGIGLTADSLFTIIKTNYYNIVELLSQIYLSDSGYFFITLIIQNGTISSIYYLLRFDELMFNAFSPEISFYRRHFINLGHAWHRNEGDCFLFGYFYSQLMVFYTICLVFATTMPIISLAGLYLFTFRHCSDFISFLMVHHKEIDSNGKLINQILNKAYVPVLLYHLFMISVFVSKGKYKTAIGVCLIFILSVIYMIKFHSDYLLDVYSLHEQLAQYEEGKGQVDTNTLNEWRNKFRHPLCIPIFVEKEKPEPYGMISEFTKKEKEKELKTKSKSGIKALKLFEDRRNSANSGEENKYNNTNQNNMGKGIREFNFSEN